MCKNVSDDGSDQALSQRSNRFFYSAEACYKKRGCYIYPLSIGDLPQISPIPALELSQQKGGRRLLKPPSTVKKCLRRLLFPLSLSLLLPWGKAREKKEVVVGGVKEEERALSLLAQEGEDEEWREREIEMLRLEMPKHESSGKESVCVCVFSLAAGEESRGMRMKRLSLCLSLTDPTTTIKIFKQEAAVQAPMCIMQKGVMKGVRTFFSFVLVQGFVLPRSVATFTSPGGASAAASVVGKGHHISAPTTLSLLSFVAMIESDHPSGSSPHTHTHPSFLLLLSSSSERESEVKDASLCVMAGMRMRPSVETCPTFIGSIC